MKYRTDVLIRISDTKALIAKKNFYHIDGFINAVGTLNDFTKGTHELSHLVENAFGAKSVYLEGYDLYIHCFVIELKQEEGETEEKTFEKAEQIEQALEKLSVEDEAASYLGPNASSDDKRPSFSTKDIIVLRSQYPIDVNTFVGELSRDMKDRLDFFGHFGNAVVKPFDRRYPPSPQEEFDYDYRQVEKEYMEYAMLASGNANALAKLQAYWVAEEAKHGV